VAARVELVYERAHGTRDTLLGRLVRLHKLNPVDPWLESAWFQPLNEPTK
jgi:hypothetical protein